MRISARSYFNKIPWIQEHIDIFPYDEEICRAWCKHGVYNWSNQPAMFGADGGLEVFEQAAYALKKTSGYKRTKIAFLLSALYGSLATNPYLIWGYSIAYWIGIPTFFSSLTRNGKNKMEIFRLKIDLSGKNLIIETKDGTKRITPIESFKPMISEQKGEEEMIQKINDTKTVFFMDKENKWKYKLYLNYMGNVAPNLLYPIFRQDIKEIQFNP